MGSASLNEMMCIVSFFVIIEERWFMTRVLVNIVLSTKKYESMIYDIYIYNTYII